MSVYDCILAHVERLTWKVLPTDVEIVCAGAIDHAGVKGAALAAASMQAPLKDNGLGAVDTTTSAIKHQSELRAPRFTSFQVITSTVTVVSVCLALHSLSNNNKRVKSEAVVQHFHMSDRNLLYIHCALAIGQIGLLGAWLVGNG